jgi:hypothetical protein
VAIVRDCGDFEIKVGFSLGLTYTPPIARDHQAKIADQLGQLGPEIQQRRERMELELIDFVCEKLGYDEAKIKNLVETRTEEERGAIVREQQGRAEKNARRGGR